MKDWLTDPPEPLAIQLLQAVCKVLLGMLIVLPFLWLHWI
jgi:hypothetical protein